MVLSALTADCTHCWAVEIVGIAAGASQTVVVSRDGKVYAWGDNAAGQLGDGTTKVHSCPVRVEGLSGVVSVATGGAGDMGHTLAVTRSGSVWAWGMNMYGQLGTNSTCSSIIPVCLPDIEDAKFVAATHYRSIAMKSDETLWAWGYNVLGQTGSPPPAVNALKPVAVIGVGPCMAVSVSDNYTIAVRRDGTLWTWGSNSYGRLGDGTMINRDRPAQVKGIEDVVAVSAGAEHVVVVKRDGTVWAWGWNSYGQLGDGTTINRSVPVRVSGLTGVIAVAAGHSYTVVLKGDGTVWSWGRNIGGALGDGTTDNRLTPVQIVGLSNVKSIASGGSHVVALQRDGTVWTWGSNTWHQLGNGTGANSAVPIQIPIPCEP